LDGEKEVRIVGTMNSRRGTNSRRGGGIGKLLEGLCADAEETYKLGMSRDEIGEKEEGMACLVMGFYAQRHPNPNEDVPPYGLLDRVNEYGENGSFQTMWIRNTVRKAIMRGWGRYRAANPVEQLIPPTVATHPSGTSASLGYRGKGHKGA